MNNSAIKLEDIAELTVGFVGNMTKEYRDDGVCFFRSLNIKPFEIDSSDMLYISSEFNEKIKKSILQEGNLVIVRTGRPGACCVIPKEYDGSNCSDLVIIRPNQEQVDPYYLEAYINFMTQKQINNNQVGAIQKHFNIGSAKNMVLFMPKLKIQREIGSVVRALNSKINNNFKISAELESMAKTVYDYWFLQFEFPNEEGKPYKSSGGEMVWNEELKREIPKEWEVMTISSLCNIYQPQTISNELFDDKYTYPVYGGGGYIGRYNKYNHEDSEIVISCRGSTGNIFFSMPHSWITGNAMVVHPNENSFSKSFLFEFLNTYGVEKYITGSVQKQLTRENLSLMPVLYPHNDVLMQYERIADPIRKMIELNTIKNRELTALRDFLLPLLMNGQVGFKDE